MRICLVYDCLFPFTVGGAERWYRNLGQRLASQGHDITYLTLRQWERGSSPDVPGIRVVEVGPRMALYTSTGRRRILPPIVFGLGVLWHLLRRGDYDAVHTASFPYFSLLAAGAVRPLRRFHLVVDWHEVWTRRYWREYLGRWAGEVGWLVQLICARLPQRAFCFSQLHAERLRQEHLSGPVTVLPGEYEGPLHPQPQLEVEPVVVFAGRHIPEKRLPAIPPAVAQARLTDPRLRAVILGDGPDRAAVTRLVSDLGLEEVVGVPGFVDTERVETELASALCLLLPSRREGYGLVVLEAASHGTPSIVVAGEDNAAVELIEDGINGMIAASAAAPDLAAAILGVQRGGAQMRASTANWFAENAQRLSLANSLESVVDVYAREPSARS